MNKKTHFEWDDTKNSENQKKHGISFALAQYAFADRNRIILKDSAHSDKEDRYYCLGKVDDGIITVRFTYREDKIRIIGAGYWRKGEKFYEKENKLY